MADLVQKNHKMLTKCQSIQDQDYVSKGMNVAKNMHCSVKAIPVQLKIVKNS